MKIQKKARKKASPKTKAGVFLAIMLVITLGLTLLGTLGSPIPFSGGLYKLRAWVPTTNAQNWPDALMLGTDLNGGTFAEYEVALPEGDEGSMDQLMKETVKVVKSRLNNRGYTDSNVKAIGNEAIRVEIPETTNSASVFTLLSAPGKLAFLDPQGNEFMGGEDVTSAKAVAYQQSSTSYGYGINFKLSSEGKKLFGEMTTKSIGETIAIQLDGKTLMEPVVNQAITEGEGMIEGGFTAEEANNIAIQIDSGQLPLTLTQRETGAFTPTLGENALGTILTVGAIVMGLMVLALLVVYRLSGLAASWALWMYVLITFFLFAVIPGIQFSLPSFIALAIGTLLMVSSAAVLMCHMGGEMVQGRGIRGSANIGFKKGRGLVLKANLGAAVIGLGFAIIAKGVIFKSFGYILLIGALISLISSLVMTKSFIQKMATFVGDKPSLFTAKKAVK